MKKILAVALAIVMMFAVCVPAFAAGEQTIAKADVDAGNPSKDVQVYTLTTDETGEDAYTYSVTIPAEIPVAWGDTSAQDAGYTVTSQLLLGASLTVNVVANDEGLMTAAGTTATLTYALANGGETTFAEVNDAAAPAAQPTVTIADFSGVPLTQYTGTMTYTVTYNAPAVVEP